VQSITPLVRVIFVRPPKEMAQELPPGMIFKVVKPLYGVPEAGMHWYGTYSTYHREKLSMDTSTFDPCLLVTRDEDGPFGMVGMQTDDTLILGDDAFVEKEGVELEKAKLIAKLVKSLTRETPLLFNGCKLVTNDASSSIIMV
jgi:hypothetical protein